MLAVKLFLYNICLCIYFILNFIKLKILGKYFYNSDYNAIVVVVVVVVVFVVIKNLFHMMTLRPE